MSNNLVKVRRRRVLLYDELLPSQQIKLLERAEAAKYWQMLACVDVVKELNPIKIGSCRYCWGIGNEYQSTQQELRDARRKHLKEQLKLREQFRVPFDEKGGDGFNRNKKPNPECPECFGDGIEYYTPIDFDNLSEGARMLWDGVKVTNNGKIEHKLRPRDRAMENLQRIMGYDIPPQIPDFENMPDASLDQALEKAASQGLISEEEISTIVEHEPLDEPLTEET